MTIESMATKKDFIRAAITAYLAPTLTRAGFYRYQPKHFVRVRGDLVDIIAFQLSQWGGRDFYLHRGVVLLPNPAMSIDGSRVGGRTDRSPDTDIKWAGATEEEAALALQNVEKFVTTDILPWFGTINSVRDYAIEYIANPNTHLESMEMAVALLRAGFTNRAWWICERLSSRQNYLPPFEAWEERQMVAALELQQTIDTGSYQAQLDAWKSANIQKYKLEKAIV